MKESSRTSSASVPEDDSMSLSSTFTNTDGMPTLKPYLAGPDSDDDNNSNDDSSNNAVPTAKASSGRSSSNSFRNNRKAKSNGNDSSSEDSDEGDNFSVKTHLDSVSSLPKKRRQRRTRSNAKQSDLSGSPSVTSRDGHGRIRKVQFDTSFCDCHESNEYLPEDDDQEDESAILSVTDTTSSEEEHSLYDVSARWYGPQDYKHFKLNVISIVKAVFKAQRHRARNVEQDNFSYSGTLETVYDACFQMELEVPKCNILSKQEQREFQRIYRSSVDVECCLGLERLLVQRIGKDRSELRTSLFGIIQDLQTSEGWPTRELLDDNIFQISQEVSRPARLFARHIALAQAASVAKEAKYTSRKQSQQQQYQRQSEDEEYAADLPPHHHQRQHRKEHYSVAGSHASTGSGSARRNSN